MNERQPRNGSSEYERMMQGEDVSLRKIVEDNPMLGMAVGQLINLGVVQMVYAEFDEETGLDVRLVKPEVNHLLKRRQLEADSENPDGTELRGVIYEAMLQ